MKVTMKISMIYIYPVIMYLCFLSLQSCDCLPWDICLPKPRYRTVQLRRSVLTSCDIRPARCSFPYCCFKPIQYPPALAHTKSPQRNHNTSTVPIIMPANLKAATLLPDAAMRPSLCADPLSVVPIEENVSDYKLLASLLPSIIGACCSYCVINNVLCPSIIVDVHSDAPQGTDFRRQLTEPAVILALTVISFCHSRFSNSGFCWRRDGWVVRG
jgi:hypothetical protein